jgi:hypothetical protein
LAWSRRYLETGVLPPPAPRVERTEAGAIERDANGLAKGGIRQPFVEVPIATNTSEGCPLWGTHRAWSSERIKQLYPTHDAYVSKIKAWADHEVALGWMLRKDRRDVIAKAQRFDGPWAEGTCYDTYNAQANEAGPLSGALAPLTHDAALPLGAGPLLRDLNCNAVAALGL